MIIEILSPYNKDYHRAYLVNSQGRNSVCLYNTETKARHTVSYARYLMATSLNRFLTDDEEVDHIDNDKTNDSIDNLQLLSRTENIKKQKRLIGLKKVLYECPVCNEHFSVRKGLSHLVNKRKKSMTCSRSCGGKISHMDIENRILFIKEYLEH